MHNAYTASPTITCAHLTVLPTIVCYIYGILEAELIAGKLVTCYLGQSSAASVDSLDVWTASQTTRRQPEPSR